MNSAKKSKPLRRARSEPTMYFEVSEGGTLRSADFVEAETRAEFYEDVASRWDGSPANLADAMDECQPLAWEVLSIYSDCREELQSEIDSAENRARPNRKKIVMLNARLASMPEESEDAVRSWLLGVDSNYFATNIAKRVGKWFSEPPNWGWEDDYVPGRATAQGFALNYFRKLDRDSLKLLGIELVEGEYPGSSYYAAELRRGVEEANAAAQSAGLPIRFVVQTS